MWQGQRSGEKYGGVCAVVFWMMRRVPGFKALFLRKALKQSERFDELVRRCCAMWNTR